MVQNSGDYYSYGYTSQNSRGRPSKAGERMSMNDIYDDVVVYDGRQTTGHSTHRSADHRHTPRDRDADVYVLSHPEFPPVSWSHYPGYAYEEDKADSDWDEQSCSRADDTCVHSGNERELTYVRIRPHRSSTHQLYSVSPRNAHEPTSRSHRRSTYEPSRYGTTYQDTSSRATFQSTYASSVSSRHIERGPISRTYRRGTYEPVFNPSIRLYESASRTKHQGSHHRVNDDNTSTACSNHSATEYKPSESTFKTQWDPSYKTSSLRKSTRNSTSEKSSYHERSQGTNRQSIYSDHGTNVRTNRGSTYEPSQHDSYQSGCRAHGTSSRTRPQSTFGADHGSSSRVHGTRPTNTRLAILAAAMWRTDLQAILTGAHSTLPAFPDPPTRSCGRPMCAVTPFKDVCACGLREILEAMTANLSFVQMKRERAAWHPDRFVACKDAIKADATAKATEVFSLLGTIMEERK